MQISDNAYHTYRLSCLTPSLTPSIFGAVLRNATDRLELVFTVLNAFAKIRRNPSRFAPR